jgi:hypothetical protein
MVCFEWLVDAALRVIPAAIIVSEIAIISVTSPTIRLERMEIRIGRIAFSGTVLGVCDEVRMGKALSVRRHY